MCSHDCSPNAFWNFHDPILELKAGSYIPEGGELTISYLSSGDLCLPSIERQRRLTLTRLE